MTWPIVAVVIAMAAFQVGAAIAKQLFAAVGPQGAAALRLGFGALMLLAFARPAIGRQSVAGMASMLGLGVAMGGTILMFYLAIDRLPLGIVIALQFLGPLAVAIAGSRRMRDFAWAALAAGGVWGLVGSGRAIGALDPVGVACALGAAVCWAGYILCGQRAAAFFGKSTAALSVTVAALVVLPVGVYEAGGALLSIALLPVALLVALLSTALPFSLELYAMPRMPARTFAVFTSLEPLFGVLSGLLLLHEQLSIAQYVGIAMVIVAAAGSAWSGTTDAARVAPPAVE